MFSKFKKKETWLGKISRLFDRDSVGEETWNELEELLILDDVGTETTSKLLDKVKRRIKAEKLLEPSQIKAALKEEMINLLNVPRSEPSTATTNIILVVGVNGSGKTTSIAKLAYSYTSQGKRVILAAADTFRAAAVEQLQYWGEKVGAEVIAHKPGGDPAAVAFDAIEAAYSRGVPVVIIDTAGRLHTKSNLMEELKKIKRVASRHDASAPHQILLVLDATTGQNGLTQARYFTQTVGVSDIFLAKLDSAAKGGIVFAICDELNIPITYIGSGEKLHDIAFFDAETFVDAIL
ncbi:MAG: signal recognition particle-docking protein FtsY [Chloroflexota bacterium]|nr:signal recognition particle-docking protein FtsY [Chloroflexota bacterium]